MQIEELRAKSNDNFTQKRADILKDLIISKTSEEWRIKSALNTNTPIRDLEKNYIQSLTHNKDETSFIMNIIEGKDRTRNELVLLSKCVTRDTKQLIENSFEKGVDAKNVSWLLFKNLESKQFEIALTGLEQGLSQSQVQLFAKPNIEPDIMQEIKDGLLMGKNLDEIKADMLANVEIGNETDIIVGREIEPAENSNEEMEIY